MKTRKFSILKLVVLLFFTSIAIIILSISQTAIAATSINDKIAKGETTITLEEDLKEDILVPEGKTLTIDLNGHTLTTATQRGVRGIINRGSLTIKATNGGTVRNGTYTNGSYGIIDNYGTLTIDGGTFQDYGQADGSSIKNRNGTITINAGQIISNADGQGNACLYSEGTLTVADGVSFSAKSAGAYPFIVNSGTAIVGNVTVDGVKGGFAVNSGNVTINGGTYKGNNYYGIWITNNGNSQVTINNGSFTGKYGLYTAVDDGRQDVGDTQIIINNGTFTGTVKSAVAMNTSGSVRDWGMTIKGGTYSTDVSDYVPEGYSVYTLEDKYVVDKAGELSANKEKIIMPVGETQSLGISVVSDLKKYLTITSSNPSVAKVNENFVEALSVGTSKITANLNNGQKVEIDVTVFNVVAEDTESTQDVTANNQTSALVNNILEGNQIEGIDEDTVNKIRQAVNEDKIIKTEVATNTIGEENISQEIEKTKEKLNDDEKIAGYYDINVLLKADEQVIGKVTLLQKEIPITVEIPSNLPKLEEGYQRTYKIVGVHDDNVEEFEAVDNKDGTITFRTKKFSVYALAYKDTKTQVATPTPASANGNEQTGGDDNTNQSNETNETNQTNTTNEAKNTAVETKKAQSPRTGDNITTFVVVLLIAAVSLYIINKFRKNMKDKN